MRLPPLAAEILAGYVAGSAKTLAFYPIDTLTTMRELRVRQGQGRAALPQYYAGCGLTLLGALPYAILFHTAFWACEALLRPDSRLPAAAIKLCASVCGGS